MFDFELCPHVENVEGEDMMTKPGLQLLVIFICALSSKTKMVLEAAPEKHGRSGQHRPTVPRVVLVISSKSLGWPGFGDWLLPPPSGSCRPELESSLALHRFFFFPPKGFCRNCQLLKVLRKQHKGTGQSSGSKRQEDYAKVFERILSGGEIFEGDLPPSSSVSSRNPGKKRGKRETGRKTRERDTI